MQKKKVMVLLAAIVVIGGVVFTWAILPKKTEEVVSDPVVVEQVEETVVEEEVIDFSLVESDSEVIVLNDTKIRKEPKLTGEELGIVKKDSILAVEYSVFRDSDFDGWVQVTVDGVTGYIQDVEYYVPEEVVEEVAETEQTEEVAEETTESIVSVEDDKSKEGVSEEKPDTQPKEEPKQEAKKEEPKQEAKKEDPKPATPDAPVQTQDEAQKAAQEEILRKMAERGTGKSYDDFNHGVATDGWGTGEHFGNAE